MITSAIISIFASFLYLVFQFIPQVNSAPTWWVENVQPSLGIFIELNQFPIIGTIFTMVLLAITFMSAWQVIVFSNWLYNKIRGSG